MKKISLLMFCLLFSVAAFGQFNLGNKVRNKVNQRIDQKIDKAIDKVLDGAEKTQEEEDSAEDESPEENDESVNTTSTSSTESKKEAEVAPALVSYTKFDFIPGEQLIFSDDFAKDRLGEFPDNWLTNGMGQTVKLSTIEGQWLRLADNSKYSPDKKFDLPENYTLEFDLLNIVPKSSSLGYFYIKFAAIKDENILTAYNYPNTETGFHIGYNFSYFRIDDSETKINNNVQKDILYENVGKPVHVSIAVNGQRYRLWINEQKIFDIPQLLPKGSKHNVIMFRSDVDYDDDTRQMLVSNFRLAKGKPDLRKSLVTDGKFVTSGITFDTGSDKIKPESYGLLREIAMVMNETPDLRLKITGHTDSDGDEKANLQLSVKRAEAIKKALEESFQVAGKNLEIDGLGESKPVSSNDTEEGKANNRRAEFIRL